MAAMSERSELEARLEATLLAMLARLAPGKTLSPADVAIAVGGKHPDDWSPLMQPLRRVAVRLAHAGRLDIVRKGRIVDPDDFKGVYRLAGRGSSKARD
jgi:hypothetical protein